MQESQWVGLLVLAGGIFGIAAAVGDWDFFMNSRKAKAWVKRIGRDNARKMYGGIGAFVACFGLYMIIFAPGDNQNQIAQANPANNTPASQNPPAAQPGTTPPQPVQTPVFSEYGDSSPTSNAPTSNAPTSNTPTSNTPTTTPQTPTTNSPSTPISSQPSAAPSDNPSPPDNRPATPTNPPKPVATQLADGAVDLLSMIDPQRDRIKADFSLQNGTLITPLDKPAIMQVPVDLPANYRVTAIVEEREINGNGSFSLGVNVQGHGVSIVIAGTNGDTSGLQLVDNKITRSNPTYRRGPLMTSGPNKIVVTVRGNQLTVVVNDEKIIDWNEPERLAFGFEAKKGRKDQLKIGSWAGSYRVSQLAIETLEN